MNEPPDPNGAQPPEPIPPPFEIGPPPAAGPPVAPPPVSQPPPLGQPPHYWTPGYPPPPKKTNLALVLTICGVLLLAPCLILPAILLPVFQHAKLSAQRKAKLSYLKIVGLECLMYANDHDDSLPDLSSMSALRAELHSDPDARQYAADKYYSDPITHRPFVLNAKLSHKKTSSLKSPDAAILAYDDRPETGGGHLVVFADGHAIYISDEAFQQDLK